MSTDDPVPGQTPKNSSQETGQDQPAPPDFSGNQSLYCIQYILNDACSAP